MVQALSKAEAAINGAFAPPSNPDFERCVLGGILLDPQLLDEISTVVCPEDFREPEHQTIFRHLLAMHNDGHGIDSKLLTERLQKAGDLGIVGGLAYLAEIAIAVPIAAHAVHYARIVREKSTLRALIEVSHKLLEGVYEPSADPEELLSAAEEKILAVRDRRQSSDPTSIEDVLITAFDQLIHRQPTGGVRTGLVDLDAILGGLHPAQLIVLAARTGIGKTALAMNIAEEAALRGGTPTLFVSLEMSRLELAQRILCSHSRVSGYKLRNGFLSPPERSALIESSAALSRAPLSIDDASSRSVTEIAAMSRRMKRKQGLGLVIIDYLQLIEPDSPRDPRQEQVAKITRRLKTISRELSVPVLCLAQLNRQADATDATKPRLSHLRESGAIEQDADVVLLLHRPKGSDDSRESTLAELNVAKQRNGPTREDIKLVWLPDCTRFCNFDRSHGNAWNG